jgi:hypothetical protein
MYRVKTNGKYVLLIKDLNLTLSYDNIDGATLADEDFENSVDIKKVLRYLSVEKLDDSGKTESVSNTEAIVEDEKKVFVSHEETSAVVEDVYVREVESAPETKIEEPRVIPDVEPKAVENITEKVAEKVEEKSKEAVTTEVVKEEKPQVKEDKFSNVEAEVKKINNKKNKSSK